MRPYHNADASRWPAVYISLGDRSFSRAGKDAGRVGGRHAEGGTRCLKNAPGTARLIGDQIATVVAEADRC